MSSLPVLAWQPLSDIGGILAGAKAYFYRTGTTTPKNTYSVKALTSGFENANPVEADAYGRFGPIFLLKDEGYRVVLKTSADVTIWTKDEVFAESFAVDEQLRRKAIALSPMDYGATGDGTADDTTKVQAAIDAAAGGVVDLEGKTYKCTGTISIATSGTTIRNGKLLFTSAAASPITVTGTLGSSVNFAANGSLGATSVTLTSGSAFAALDLVAITSASATWGANVLGQLEYLKGVSGAVLTLSSSRGTGTGGALLAAYNTADTAKAQKITPITDVRFENVTIETQATSAQAITFALCERISIKGCRFLLASNGIGVVAQTSASVIVDGCHFAPNTTSAIQAAVDIRASSRDVTVRDCRVRNSTYGILAGDTAGSVEGVCRYIAIDLVIAELVDKAVWLKNGTKDVELSKCIFNGGNGSGSNTDLVDVEGYDVSISDCQIIDPVRHWIRIHPQDNTADTVDGYASYRIADCKLSGVGSSTGCLVAVDPETGSGVGYGAKVSITGNTFSGGSQLADAIYIGNSSGDGVFQAVNITDNTFTGLFVATGDYVVHVKCNDAAKVNIADNVIYGQTTAGGVHIEAGADDISIADNEFGMTGAAIGVLLADAAHAKIVDNEFTTTTTGISVSVANVDLADLVISGNRIPCSDDGVQISVSSGRALSRVVLAGNAINNSTTTATEYCIELLTAGTGTITKVTLSGNVCDRADDSGPSIYLNGAGGAISQVSAVGNVLSNGTYGFSLVQVTGFSHSHNTFNGMATGQATGTFTKDGSKGFIHLDINTARIINANNFLATTEAGIPDTNTDPSIQRTNGATDKSVKVIWPSSSVVEIQFSPFAYPPDLDDGEPVTVCLLARMGGASDTPVIAVGYWEGVGDTNAGGNTAALSSSIAKKTVAVAAADIGAYPTAATVTLTPGAHGTDVLELYAAWIEYSKKPSMNAS